MSNSQSRWRPAARRIIAGVIAAHPGLDEADLRKTISAAYPWGPRQFHPYKIWLSEVARALNPPKAKPTSKSDRAQARLTDDGGDE